MDATSSSSSSSSSTPSSSSRGGLIGIAVLSIGGIIVLVLWLTGVLGGKKNSSSPSAPSSTPSSTPTSTLMTTTIPTSTLPPAYLPNRTFAPVRTSSPSSLPSSSPSSSPTATSPSTLSSLLKQAQTIVGQEWQGTVPFVFPGNLTVQDASILYNNGQPWQCGWLCTADENDHSGSMLFSTQADGSWVLSGGMWDMAHIDPKTSTLVFESQPSFVFTVTVLSPSTIVLSRQTQPGVSNFYVIRP